MAIREKFWYFPLSEMLRISKFSKFQNLESRNILKSVNNVQKNDSKNNF